MTQTGFEPQQEDCWQGVAAGRGGRTGLNRKKFELYLPRGNP